MIGWRKRDPLGRPMWPWEVITLDQLEETARLLIIKQARLAARDFYEGMREEFAEDLRVMQESASIEMGKRLAQAMEPLTHFPHQTNPEDSCES